MAELIEEPQKPGLGDRTQYIGASEAAAVLGMSRWSTPLRVWAEKTGQIPIEERDTLAQEVGKELEELVCKLFTKRTGKAVKIASKTLVHPEHDFIRANLDRELVDENAILEAKTASGWKAHEWEDDLIPIEYRIQCLHQLALCKADRCYIAVLIGGNQDFKWKVVERDDKIIAEIIQKEVRFWNDYIVPKVMPMFISKNDAPTLEALFPEGDEGTPIELGDKANRILESLEAMELDLDTLDDSIDKQKNILKAMLGDHSIGLTDRFKVTWKNQVRMALDQKELKQNVPDVVKLYTKESRSRVFRYAQLKPEVK